MHSVKKVLWAVCVVVPFLLVTGVSASEVDDEVPEVTDRVARISSVSGDVQIRREDAEDWEKAVLDLPIVEGDEIITGPDGRFEIQFDSSTHLRVAANSQLKIVGLRDEGIAISLPQGTLNLRTVQFDPDKSFFEIDAPKTTVSVQKPGSYRVDAGKEGDSEIRISVTGEGEARVYAENSGFTVKNGRSARIFINGDLAGEWETADAANFRDEFDDWGLERDVVIANKLKDAHYGEYYDNDIYGAEELDDHGDWVHTSEYGYVWRPYDSSINRYSNWSPYRYGHWRWVPAYGWSWVNDEPWGWATYHHGRWVWHNGRWYWSPYGQYRSSRSWWRPALVVLSVVDNNVCWYPLQYNRRFYDYNRHYNRNNPRRRRDRDDRRDNWPGRTGQQRPGTNRPNPTPVTPLPPRSNRQRVPALDEVPQGGVVTVEESEFGRNRGGFRVASQAAARRLLSRDPDEIQNNVVLPTYRELNNRVSREIRSDRRPAAVQRNPQIKVGAGERSTNAPLDRELRKSRILGNRPPMRQKIEVADPGPGSTGVSTPRNTGAVERPVVRRENAPTGGRLSQPDAPVQQSPTDVQPQRRITAPRAEPRRQDTPESQPRPRSDRSIRLDPPPTRTENPPARSEQPVRREPPPRLDPPARNSPPPQRSSPPERSNPPARTQPPPQRSSPPEKRSDPPPQKSAPPDKPAPIQRKSRDGR